MTRHPIGLPVTLALGLLVVPITTRAQQLAKIPRIGYLADSARRAQSEALRRALRELGYVEGQTIVFEWRLADTPEQYPALAAELVGLKVDITEFQPSSDADCLPPLLYSPPDRYAYV